MKAALIAGVTGALSVAIAREGAWVFEADKSRRLSAQMLSSRAGYRFLSVGTDHGILVTPDNGPVAVRWVDSTIFGWDSAGSVAGAELPTAELQAAMAAARQARETLRAPCPRDADDDACAAWCAAVAPQGVRLSGKREGISCANGDYSQNGPLCSCHRLFSVHRNKRWAMCRSTCPVHRKGDTTAPDKPGVVGVSDEDGQGTVEPASARPESGLRSRIQHASTSSTKRDAVSPTRYLIYDTRFGLSFAAQIEVFFAAMEITSKLNGRVAAKCGENTSGLDCAKWILVLPPWCSVVKWYGENTGPGKPWRDLFDVTTLLERAPVADFFEFAGVMGASVDLAVLPAVGVPVRVKDGNGEFVGWESQLETCQVGAQQVPQAGVKGGKSLVYSGYCDGDLLPARFECAMLRRASFTAVLDMLSSIRVRTQSVLIKHLDALHLHNPAGAVSIQFHAALRPAKALQFIADEFMTKTLGNNFPYLSVHLRRNEFQRLHPRTTPSVVVAAARLNLLLRELHLEQVFVATDGRSEFREADRKSVV